MQTNTSNMSSPIQTETPMQNQMPSSETPQSSSKAMWYVIGGLVILVAVIGIFFVALRRSKNSSYITQPTNIQQPTIQPKPTLPRSKAPSIIINVLTASSLDAQGAAATPTSTFTTTDKTIYLVLTFNNPKVGTKFEYIRYLNNTYLDSGSLKIMKPNLTNSSFSWSLKQGATHLAGNYKVKAYTNGVFEKEIFYRVL